MSLRTVSLLLSTSVVSLFTLLLSSSESVARASTVRAGTVYEFDDPRRRFRSCVMLLLPFPAEAPPLLFSAAAEPLLLSTDVLELFRNDVVPLLWEDVWN